MKSTNKWLVTLGMATLFAAQASAAPLLVAEYSFDHTLASSVGGAPALTAVDPLGQSGFRTDTVFGVSRTVYDFKGTSANAQQAGLSLDVSGLIGNNNNYSVQMQFMFTQRLNGWRRILDVENRQSDNGFYVNPSNNLAVYPTLGGAAFSNNAYHDVVLSNNNGAVTFYLDGGVQATANTSVMNISSADMLNFFLDNIVGGGQGEYSSGSVALIRIFDGALTAADVDNLPPVTSVPEPGSLMLAGLGLLAAGAARRRQRA